LHRVAWQPLDYLYENTLTLAEKLPHRVDQARVRYWYARMLLTRNESGDRDHARRMLERARALGEEMAMNGLVRSINVLSSRLMVDYSS